jgi:UPF0716 protein FxsA
MRAKLKVLVLGWVLAEVIALILAVRLAGWPLTLVAGFLTSALGLYVVRQGGRESLAALSRFMHAPGAAAEAPSAGIVRILSGLLLVIPGFVSDLAGLLLLAPAVSRALTRRFVTPVRSAPSGVLDLDPKDWAATREGSSGPSCEPAPGMLPGEPKTAHIRRLDDE